LAKRRVVLEWRESSVTLPESVVSRRRGYGTESIAAGAAVIGNAYFNQRLRLTYAFWSGADLRLLFL